jgi:hypothetical protein
VRLMRLGLWVSEIRAQVPRVLVSLVDRGRVGQAGLSFPPCFF